jgi:hypothetical protein
VLLADIKTSGYHLRNLLFGSRQPLGAAKVSLDTVNQLGSLAIGGRSSVKVL